MKKQIKFFQLKNTQFFISIINIYYRFTSWILIQLSRKYWVSKISKYKSEKILNINLYTKIKNLLYKIHLPDFWYLSIIFPITIIFIPQLIIILFHKYWAGLINFDLFENQLIFNNYLPITWQVAASLIGTMVVIVIFVSDFANKSKYTSNYIPVFFAETKILYTVSIGILTLGSIGLVLFFENFSFFSNDLLSALIIFQWLIFFYCLILIINIFIKTIRMQNKLFLQQKIQKYYQYYSKKFIFEITRNKFMSNLLINSIRRTEIDFRFLGLSSETMGENISVFIPDRSPHYISDINIKLLLTAYFNAKKIYPDIKPYDFIFYGRLNKTLYFENSIIARVGLKINLPNVNWYIKRSIRTIPKNKKPSIINNLVIENSLFKEAVKLGDYEIINNQLENYQIVIEEYLTKVNNYSLNADEQIYNSFFYIEDEDILFSAIFDQLQFLIIQQSTITEFDFIDLELSYIYRLLVLGFTHRNIIVFTKFLNSYYFMYVTIINNFSQKQQGKVLERFFLSIADTTRTINYHTNNIIRKHSEIIFIKDYYSEISYLFNKLLKFSLDSKQYQNFFHLNSIYNTFLESFGEKNLDNNITRLESEKSLLLLDGNDIDQELITKIDYLQNVKEIKKSILQLKRVIFVGLAGWLIHLYDKEKISIEDFINYLKVINNSFRNYKELYDTIIHILQNEKRKNALNWDSWEMSEWDSKDGISRSGYLTYNSWFEKYFIIYFLSKPANLNISDISLFTSIETFVDGVNTQIDFIQQSSIWTKFITNESIYDANKKLRSLKEMLKQLIARKKHTDDEFIINSQIQDTLVNQFIISFISSFSEKSFFWNNILEYKSSNSTDLNNPSIVSIPYKHFLPKGAFINQNKVHYSDMGSDFGYFYSNLFDKTIWSNILQNKQDILECQLELLLQEIDRIINDLIINGRSPIIITNDDEVLNTFEKSSDFTNIWNTSIYDENEFFQYGVFKETIIYQVDTLERNTIAIITPPTKSLLSEIEEDSYADIDILIDLLSKEEINDLITSSEDIELGLNESIEIEKYERERKLQLFVKLEANNSIFLEELDIENIHIIKISP